MKSTEKGDLGTGLVLADLLNKRFGVALPVGEDKKYDLIVDVGGSLLRVQCKATVPKNGVLRVKCRSTSSWSGKTRQTHKYTAKDIEVLAVVNLLDNTVYYIPATELGEGKSEMALRLTPPRNGQSSGIRMASTYAKFPG